MPPRFVAESQSEEWYDARSTGVGASEAAAVMGRSPRETAVDVWRRKRGLDPEIETTFDLLVGKCLEPAIAELFSQVHKVEVHYPFGMYRHGEHDFVLASPDGSADRGGAEIGIELKVMRQRDEVQRAEEEGLHRGCPQYVIQAHQQMAVMGWERVDLVVFTGWDLKVWTVERSDKLVDAILSSDAAFWELVDAGQMPAIDWEHRNVADLMRRMYPKVRRNSVSVLDADTRAKFLEAERLGTIIGNLQKRQRKLRSEVAFGMEGTERADLGDGRHVRRLKRRDGVIDLRAVKAPGAIRSRDLKGGAH